jgi:hypothetical protein
MSLIDALTENRDIRQEALDRWGELITRHQADKLCVAHGFTIDNYLQECRCYAYNGGFCLNATSMNTFKTRDIFEWLGY